MRIEEFIICEESTIYEALEQLDIVAQKVLFITKDGKLTGVLTDGDIRRWILKKGDLKAQVKSVANYSPQYLINCGKKEALQYMKTHSIEALPVLDDNGQIKKIITWDEKEFGNSTTTINLPVVMMAGGLGTRLHPYTSILPKPLVPIGEIPVAEHIINQFCKYGCSEFYLVLNYKRNMIKAYFNEIQKKYKIFYIDEEMPLGTGGGLSLLKGKITSTFILTNCDIMIDEDFTKIYRLHKEQEHIITMVCSLKKFSVPYGVVEIDENGDIARMKEKPELSFLTNTGCYIVEPQVIEQLEDDVAVGFPDIIEKCRTEGKKVGIYPIGEKAWQDMGQIDELEKMQKRFRI